MATQQYRGHVIHVTCYQAGDLIGYRSTIVAEATGERRCCTDGAPAPYPRAADAQDAAFRAARAWIERSPLRWPFPVPLAQAS